MRRLTSTRARLLAVTALLGLLAPPSYAAPDQVITIPVSGIINNPCTGEDFAYSGVIHTMTHISFDNSGGEHVTFHNNASDIKGYGLVTGTRLVGTQADNFTLNFTNGATNQTEAFSFKMVSPGPGNNFVEHSIFHVTLNADGTITAFVDNFTATCM